MSGRQDFEVPQADEGLRRCALTLHSVGLADRAWLLGQLPPSQRATLEELVAELNAIGIPRDPQAARAALESRHSTRVDRKPSDETGGAGLAAKNAVGLAAPSDLAHLLQDEPPALIAHFLGQEPCERCDAVLIQLSAPKRRQVQELLAERPIGGPEASAPRLREALSDEVARRLALVPRRPARAPKAKPLSRWARLMGVAW
jgi:hypothetical protein